MVKSFYIYLPAEYGLADHQTERYPVLYLFRGHEREWVNLHEDHSRQGRSIVDVYLELRQTGQIGPMILVCPGITSDDHKIPGLLVNFRQPELAHDAPGIGTGQFETYFTHELIPYIDRHYRTLADRRHRGVDGFSLGGFQAIKIAAQHPTLFGSAGAYDGTFFYASASGRQISPRDALFRAGIFDPAFGRPRDLKWAAANNPANLIMRAQPSDLASIAWLIQSGPESAEPSNANYYRARHLVDLLATHSIPNRLPLVIKDGQHNWATADRHMAQTLPLHWQILGGRADEVSTPPFTAL